MFDSADWTPFSRRPTFPPDRGPAPPGKLHEKACAIHSKLKNAWDLKVGERSLIERSLFEHIPIALSINVLSFLKNRSGSPVILFLLLKDL